MREQPFDRLFEFVGQLVGMFRDKARQVVTFEVLPEAFDRIEVGTVGRQVERLDVVPAQRIGMVPTGVVENQPDRLAPVRSLFGHGVEKGLRDLRIVVRHDQAHQ